MILIIAGVALFAEARKSFGSSKHGADAQFCIG
jgi:hypothetical protein